MFTTTKDDTVHNLKSSAQNLQDAAKETADDLRNAANGAGRKVREFIHSAGDELSHTKDKVTTQIRTNPVQSSLVALGVGFVLGALFRR